MSVAVGNFLIFAASQIGTPGPANMALMATGARYGLKAALPFVAGVAVGKQLIIWPIGFGLAGLEQTYPMAFLALKYLCAAYIIWLAWRVANMSLSAPGDAGEVPGFLAGLAVHPLNPKAWALVTAGFTSFVTPGTPALHATATIAICLFAVQVVLHPVWTFGGETIARAVAGRPAEKYLVRTLAALTVASVLFVLFGGGKA